MIDFVRIADIDGLDRLREALVRYGADLETALAQARGEIDRTLAYLGERFRHWKQQYEIWKAEAERRWRPLERCENEVCNGRWDRKTIHRSCSALYEEWRVAESRHRHAEGCVEQVKGLIRVVEQARDAYERDAGRIQNSVRAMLPRAQSLLGQTANRARALAAHRFAGAGLARSGTIFHDPGAASSAGAWPGAAVSAAGFSSAGHSNSDWEAGVHGPSSGEGHGKESEPGPEAGEGAARRSTRTPGRAETTEREPPYGGSKEGGF